MDANTMIDLAKTQARLWDARRGIREALDTIDDMMIEGRLEIPPELRNALVKAKDSTEDALREVMNQLEEASE